MLVLAFRGLSSAACAKVAFRAWEVLLVGLSAPRALAGTCTGPKVAGRRVAGRYRSSLPAAAVAVAPAAAGWDGTVAAVSAGMVAGTAGLIAPGRGGVVVATAAVAAGTAVGTCCCRLLRGTPAVVAVPPKPGKGSMQQQLYYCLAASNFPAQLQAASKTIVQLRANITCLTWNNLHEQILGEGTPCMATVVNHHANGFRKIILCI